MSKEDFLNKIDSNLVRRKKELSYLHGLVQESGGSEQEAASLIRGCVKRSHS